MSGAAEAVRRTGRLLRCHANRATVALVALAGAGVMIDLGGVAGQGERAAELFVSIVALVLQYGLTRSLLGELGYGVRARTRLLAFVGMGVVTTVVIAIGILLLVVPGLILLARWSTALPLLVTSDERVFACLSRGWTETRERTWPILLTLLIVYAPGFVAVVGSQISPDELWLSLPETIVTGLAVLVNLVLEGSLIAGWYASVAIFTLFHDSPKLGKILA